MDIYMKVAVDEARKGIKKGHGGPFGSCVVKDGKIIAKGHNEVLLKHDCTCHGEIETIKKACKKKKAFNLADTVLYTTAMPCPMCMGAIQWSGIKKVFYGCSANDVADIGFRDFYFSEGIKFDYEKLSFTLEQVDHDVCLELFKDYENMKKRTLY